MSEDLCGAPRKSNGRPCRQPVGVLPCQYHQTEAWAEILAALRSGELSMVWTSALPSGVTPFTYRAMAELHAIPGEARRA
jgi:hypothetical protein